MEYAMQTPDGAWRVEVVQRGGTPWYRIVHGDSELDWLNIAAVERILTEAGVDMADLTDVADHPPAPVSPSCSGCSVARRVHTTPTTDQRIAVRLRETLDQSGAPLTSSR